MKNESWEGHFSPETEEGIQRVLKMGEEMKKGIMRIYKVEFEPMWPVPYGLIIAAHGIDECDKIARKTIIHTKEFTIKEVDIIEPCVIFYESGDY
jgi:hypothetical protein